MIRRVAYPKSKWSRGEAWAHLHAQMIPGCPKRLLIFDDREVWAHGWRKCHTADEWAWSYVVRWPAEIGLPPVQLSTPSTPQENQDRNHIDEACGTKSVQIDPTGNKCPDVSV